MLLKNRGANVLSQLLFNIKYKLITKLETSEEF